MNHILKKVNILVPTLKNFQVDTTLQYNYIPAEVYS